MIFKNKTHQNVIIISVIATILIVSGVSMVNAANVYNIPTSNFNMFSGNNTFGQTTGINTNNANGVNAAAFGTYSVATGDDSIAFGSGNIARGKASAVFGINTIADNMASIAFGVTTTSSGFASAAFGDSTQANGDNSISLGYATNAQPYGSVVIGRYNEVSGTKDTWIDTDPIFVIGNGYEDRTKRPYKVFLNNALTVLKNGNLGIGTSTPNSLLQIANPTGNGYIQLDTTSGILPPSVDCDNQSEYGRMIIDDTLPYMYICNSFGWLIK